MIATRVALVEPKTALAGAMLVTSFARLRVSVVAFNGPFAAVTGFWRA
jgi:hypothetical protein